MVFAGFVLAALLHNKEQEDGKQVLCHDRFLLFSARRRDDVLLIKEVVIGGNTQILSQLGSHAHGDFAGCCPGLLEDLGIDNRQRRFQRVVTYPSVFLFDAQLIAVREAPSPVAAIFGQPRPVIVTVRFHDERGSFPMADRVSEKSRLGGILGKFSSVGPDGSPVMAPLEELNHFVGVLHELESVVVCEETRVAQRIASHHGIF